VARRLTPGRPVVLACSDRYAFMVGLAAAWSRGSVVHLPAVGRRTFVEALARGVGDAILIHDQPGWNGLSVAATTPSRPVGEPEIDWDAPAAVVYTSGSSGTPCAHTKTLGQLLGEAALLTKEFSLATRRMVSLVPSAHLYGLLFGILVPFVGGGSVSRTSPLLPSDVFSTLSMNTGDVLVAAPPHLTAIASTQPAALVSLDIVFSSGAALPDAVVTMLTAAGTRVVQVFGSTETGGIGYRVGSDQTWKTFPGVQITVQVDDRLAVDSPWLPPKEPRPFVTHDRAALEDAGFRHLGRADSIVKVGGRRVNLREIEGCVRSVPHVTAAAVLSRPVTSAVGTEILVAVEAPVGGGPTPDDLRRHLSAHLDVLPWQFRVVAQLPQNAMGKSERQVLLELFDKAHVAIPPSS
jgi:acyl-coenzyme A synthetase/AMP-(fatty) acid ligase